MHGFSYDLSNKQQRGREMTLEYILTVSVLKCVELILF